MCSIAPSRLSLALFAPLSLYAFLARAAEAAYRPEDAVLSAHGTAWGRKKAADTVEDFSQLSVKCS